MLESVRHLFTGGGEGGREPDDLTVDRNYFILFFEMTGERGKEQT